MRWKVAQTPAVIGLVVLAAYVGFQAVLQRRAVAVGDAYIAAQRLETAQGHAIPQPVVTVQLDGSGATARLSTRVRRPVAKGNNPAAAGRCFLVLAVDRVIPGRSERPSGSRSLATAP
jgi:hypothetical protein